MKRYVVTVPEFDNVWQIWAAIVAAVLSIGAIILGHSWGWVVACLATYLSGNAQAYAHVNQSARHIGISVASCEECDDDQN